MCFCFGMLSCARTSSFSSTHDEGPSPGASRHPLPSGEGSAPATPPSPSGEGAAKRRMRVWCLTSYGSRSMRTLLLLLAFTCSAETPKADFDIRIINGEVIDGTGRERYRADVGIRGDTIATIGDLSHATATTTIDARNHVVTPGFIDLLGHSEGSVLIDPNLEGKVRQGVTTELTGEGHSPGPINEPMAAEMERTKPPGWPPVSWRTLGEFMQVIENRRSAINFAFFIGAAN